MTCKRCAATEVTGSEPGRSGGNGSARAPPHYGMAVADAFRAPGEPLPLRLQARFQESFGADFRHVRVHRDAGAGEAAAALEAHAFTVGEQIAFGPDAWAPETARGDRLIAHELAHVAQQRRGPTAVQARAEVSAAGDLAEQEANAAADIAVSGLRVPPLMQAAAPISLFPYQTIGTTLSRGNIATLTSQSYWVSRTADTYDLTQSTRMASDTEEQSAVLAALWATNPPRTVTAHSERIVPVNPRPAPPPTAGSAAPAAPPALLYRFKFDPPASPGSKPLLECEFMAFGPGAIPIAAPVPAAGFAPGTLNANSSNFPNGRDAYFAAHPAEFAQLMSFLVAAPPAFDQHLTTETRSARGAVTHTTLLHVVRTASTGSSGTVGLDVDWVAEQAPLAAVSAPTDYLTRDASDFEIEKRQRTSIAVANRLGPVTLPPGLTPAEHLAVNEAIAGYFDNNARNTEVDAIIPVGATGSATALFTFRFGAGNAVTVDRIGAAGTGPGQVNTSRIDVTRVAGFPGIAATDAALRSWWTQRYPSGGALQTPVPTAGTATGAPATPNNTALIAEMNRLIVAGIVNTSWFTSNYGIEPLDPAAATARLRNVHHAPPATDPALGTLADGTKAFTPADLLLLEVSLETASTAVINALRGVKLIRMTNPIERTAGGAWQPSASATTYGFTVEDHPPSERSTLLFDSFTSGDDVLFRGSTAANALPASTMSILHELGHAAGFQGGVETTFNAWRTAHPQAAQTWYAASAAKEVFPEAFALFQTDPHFLCGSAPLLFAWFLEWSRTGTPPAANAALTAPTSCPP